MNSSVDVTFTMVPSICRGSVIEQFTYSGPAVVQYQPESFFRYLRILDEPLLHSGPTSDDLHNGAHAVMEMTFVDGSRPLMTQLNHQWVKLAEEL